MLVKSLVRVFNKSLILRVEGRHDRVVGLAHCSIDILGSFADGVDRLVDSQAQGMPVDEIKEPLCTRQDIEGAVDGQGNNGQLGQRRLF